MHEPLIKQARRADGYVFDRRAEHRVAVEWYVRAGHPDGICVKGRTVNASTTGMLVKLPAPYSVGDLVEFELWLGLLRPVRVIGLIVRRDQCRRGFYYGVEFRWMSEATRQAIGAELLRIRRNEYNEQFAA